MNLICSKMNGDTLHTYHNAIAPELTMWFLDPTKSFVHDIFLPIHGSLRLSQ